MDKIIVTNIYLNKDSSIIYLDAGKEKKIILENNINNYYWILDQTSDNQWVIISKALRQATPGRIETQNILFNTYLRMRVTDEMMGSSHCFVYSFKKIDNNDYLLYSEGKIIKEKKLKLKSLYNKIKSFYKNKK